MHTITLYQWHILCTLCLLVSIRYTSGVEIPTFQLPTPKELDINVIKQVCGKKEGGCKEKSDVANSTRAAVKEALLWPIRKGQAKGRSDEDVERYFNKMMQAKKALLSRVSLDDVVEPHDNGLWAGDQLPPEEFLDRIINGEAEDGNVSLEEPSQRRKRANGISLDYYTGNKWPSTSVNFYLDPSTFSSSECDTIRAALKLVQDSTCLTFKETLQAPYIEFLKTPYSTGSTTCGWANLGYSGAVNDVYLNFDSSLCKPGLQGTIVHETFHVLGIAHEHNRYDRDNYIEMNWDNIDAQSFDIYQHDSAYDYNPHCIKYDYDSCMHYSPYVAALDPSKPAFVPKSYPDYYLPRIGTANSPSANDIELIKRHYCTESTCKDSSPYCGWTACDDCSTYKSSCPHSCDGCPTR